jgi:hypothetical protein
MARTKKSKKGAPRRRRSARVGKIDFMQPLALVGGAIAGNYVKKALGETLTFGGKDYSGAGVLVAGVLLRTYGKTPLMKGLGDGMIVSGGISTIHTFIPSLPINGVDMIGLSPVNVIQGYLGPHTINGVDMIGQPQEQILSYMEPENEHAF